MAVRFVFLAAILLLFRDRFSLAVPRVDTDGLILLLRSFRSDVVPVRFHASLPSVGRNCASLCFCAEHVGCSPHEVVKTLLQVFERVLQGWRVPFILEKASGFFKTLSTLSSLVAVLFVTASQSSRHFASRYPNDCEIELRLFDCEIELRLQTTTRSTTPSLFGTIWFLVRTGECFSLCSVVMPKSPTGGDVLLRLQRPVKHEALTEVVWSGAIAREQLNEEISVKMC
eukprot:2680000-Rhodomonas_salina.3